MISSLTNCCQRVYSVATLVGYAVIVAMTWPLAMMYGVPALNFHDHSLRLNSTSASSLANGGPAGNVWVFLGVCVTMLTVVLSMAEMASM